MEQTTQEQTTASTIGAVVDALIRTDKAGGAMFVALCYDLRKQNHAHYTAERIEALARLYGLLPEEWETDAPVVTSRGT